MERVEAAFDAYRAAVHCNPRFYPARENMAHAALQLEALLYKKAPDLQEPTEEMPEYTEEDLANAPLYTEGDQIPGWYYLDETAHWLRGWPGNRTRPGRMGLDPLDKEFELAHIQGWLIRRLWLIRLRTRNVFYFSVLVLLTLMFILPTILFIYSDLPIISAVYSVYSKFLSIDWILDVHQPGGKFDCSSI